VLSERAKIKRLTMQKRKQEYLAEKVARDRGRSVVESQHL
jgi:hypothetical protein